MRMEAGLRVCVAVAVLVSSNVVTTSAQSHAPGAVAPTPSSSSDAESSTEPTSHSWLQAETAYEGLSHGYDAWRSTTLSLGVERRDGRALYGSVARTTRFSLLDHEITIGVRSRPARRVIVSAEAEASPSHHVSPTWGMLGHVDIDAGGGWGVEADIRHRHYASDDVELGAMTIERYVAQFRVAYVLSAARLGGGAAAFGQRAQGDVYYGPRTNRIGLIVSTGNEIEHVEPLGVLRTPVRAIAIVGRQWLASRWFLSYDASVHEQGALYTRRRVNVGLGTRF